jgi:hypothetical protein
MTTPRLSPDLLQSIAQAWSRLAVEPGDLEALAASLPAQLEGLARLDELDLTSVEPATTLRPDLEEQP